MISTEDAETKVKFELKPTLKGSTDAELLEELQRCAAQLDQDTITMAEFNEIGKGHSTTITRRFGSWPKALELAGLQPSRSKIGISERELFENLRDVWLSLNRQPKYEEIGKPFSKFSARTYEKRFGTWTKALAKFITWVNDGSHQGEELPEPESRSVPSSSKNPRHTKREISDRQRFRVLLNAGFRCQSCGASPLSKPGTELHVDHIIPWSKGGETVDDNLACKCVQCNLGKGNAFNL